MNNSHMLKSNKISQMRINYIELSNDKEKVTSQYISI